MNCTAACQPLAQHHTHILSCGLCCAARDRCVLLFFGLVGAAPRVLKRTLQTALVWTLYEELLPRLTSVYHLAVAQQDAAQEQQASSSN